MKVILLEDIKTLGKTGEAVEVAEGYARNYLVPRKLAVTATKENKSVFDNEKKARAKKRERERGAAEGVASKLKDISVTIARMAGEEDKLFGSVTNADIAEALKEQGIEIDKRKIELDQPIKALGIREVNVHLHSDVQTLIKVWVVKQGGDSEEGGEEEVQDHTAPLTTEEERAALKAAAKEKEAAAEAGSEN